MPKSGYLMTNRQSDDPLLCQAIALECHKGDPWTVRAMLRVDLAVVDALKIDGLQGSTSTRRVCWCGRRSTHRGGERQLVLPDLVCIFGEHGDDFSRQLLHVHGGRSCGNCLGGMSDEVRLKRAAQLHSSCLRSSCVTGVDGIE